MIKIDVEDQIGAAEIGSIQQSYYSSGLFNEDEIYYSPDMSKCLYLVWDNEIPFGPSIYKAKICELKKDGKIDGTLKTFKRFIFFSRKFLSAGRYGNSFDHWSANPWSKDSKYVSLAEVETETKKYRMSILDIDSMRLKEVKSDEKYLGHHMWAPNSNSYLFRSYRAWHLFSFDTNLTRTVCETKSFPKHCFFDETGDFLIELNDAMTVKVINAKSLEIESEKTIKNSLSNDERVDFSIWDPFKKRVVLGVNFESLDKQFVKCKRWLAINLTRI